MVDMEMLRNNFRNLVIVEDAAQAHGAMYNLCRPGWFSDAACYSHYPTKNLGSLGEGGSVTTKLPIIAERVRLMRDAGRIDRYVHLMPGINSMLDEIQAAVLNVKLPYLHSQNLKRGHAEVYYRVHLFETGDIKFQGSSDRDYTINHLFVIKTARRSEVLDNLISLGIPALVHYPCTLARQPFAVAAALDQGPFPVADEVAAQVLSLPMFPSITHEEQDRVIAAVKEVYA
jgi:dTDP-4-amino-4,6-dideoxygalactose transaminase